MRVLVVGAGGREHALAWSIARGDHEVLALPGNPGIAEIATLVPGAVDDVAAVVRAARETEVDLVVVGPEAPLAAGLVDALAEARVPTFGPTAGGARIEASKSYAKEVMARASVPTARAVTAKDLDTALAAVREAGGRCVVKADGLAAGKGVVVADDGAQAERAVRACFDGAFGSSGATVVVEERLEGPELSLLVLCDGNVAVPLPAAQDHKPIGEGDTGPNTGGMGAYSPVPAAPDPLVDEVMDTIVEPTLWSLGKDGVTYRGVLYAGLMLTDGGPKVIEFNCRFGDPEAQVVLPRLGGDVGELLASAAAGALDPSAVVVEGGAALTVVAAADGYPGTPRKGDPIEGLDDARDIDGVTVFHSGTALDANGRVTTAGGRVLAVTGTADDLETARERAYAGVDAISWRDMYVRRDIGWRALDTDA